MKWTNFNKYTGPDPKKAVASDVKERELSQKKSCAGKSHKLQ